MSAFVNLMWCYRSVQVITQEVTLLGKRECWWEWRIGLQRQLKPYQIDFMFLVPVKIVGGPGWPVKKKKKNYSLCGISEIT